MALLKKGDQVALIAPSGWVKKSRLKDGLAWLEKQGLKPVLMPHAFQRHFYMAGSDEARAEDINAAFADRAIKAVFCIRGGAGCTRVLPYVDWKIIKKNPKPIFGLSDSTALQNAAYALSQNVSWTGFLPIFDFKNGPLDKRIEKSMHAVLAGQPQVLKGGKTLIAGKAEGVLVGGCLSVLHYLAGTKYLPDLKDKILLIEDVSEHTYKLDLMLHRLSLEKDFSKIKGLVFGQFLDCTEADSGDGTVHQIIKEFALKYNVPTLENFPYGHIKSRYVLPIGARVVLDADKKELKISSLK